MMIEIDTTRYAKVGRGTALAVLEEAQVKPDKFIAHRNRTFTAQYLRDRNPNIDIGQVEAIDKRVAVLKNPSEMLDKGRYITFQFAMASPEKLGIKVEKPKKKVKETQVQINENVYKLVHGVARNMEQLANFAHNLATTEDKHNHLVLTIEELQSQSKLLQESLKHIVREKKIV